MSLSLTSSRFVYFYQVERRNCEGSLSSDGAPVNDNIESGCLNSDCQIVSWAVHPEALSVHLLSKEKLS